MDIADAEKKAWITPGTCRLAEIGNPGYILVPIRSAGFLDRCVVVQGNHDGLRSLPMLEERNESNHNLQIRLLRERLLASGNGESNVQ